MKKILSALLFLTFVVAWDSHAEVYTLNDLYRIALERSRSIGIAEEDVFIAEQDRDRAMAVLIPTFSAFGSHTEYSNNGRLQPDSSTSWGLKVDQSLSMSGRELTALRIAKDTIVRSRFDLDAVRELYLLNTASAYYDVLKAKKAFDIAVANVERLTKHRDAAQIRLKVGEITKTVLLRAEAELTGAQSELIRSDNALKLATAVLARTVGITTGIELKEDEGAVQSLGMLELDVPLEYLKQIALSERYDIKSIILQKEIAEKQIRYTKGLFWPGVSVEGVYSRRDDHPSVSTSDKENIYGLLRIDYPFFEGGLRKAEVRQAEARLRQADHRMRDLEDAVNVEVESSYLNMLTVSGVMEKLQSEVEYARDNYNSVTKQFQYGLADSLDVMDANNLLVTAERQLANARYDHELAILQVQRATGTLLKNIEGQLPPAGGQ